MKFNPQKPYKPPQVSRNSGIVDQEILEHLVEARAHLGELKGYGLSMPNQRLLLSPAIMREAVASSGIENIHTTIANVFENQLFEEDERSKSNKEVLRYNQAINWGFQNLEKLSISTRLILGIKKNLLPESTKTYRKIQNHITSSSTGKTIYTPPIAADIPDLIKDLENFMNDKKVKLDPLIKTAMCHYQFEAIHPFEDGNGRTGRILMVLYLVHQKVLDFPTLFISGYLINHRKTYYELLLNVSKQQEWKPYILFMLKGYASQASATKLLLFKFMNEYEKQKEAIKTKLPKIYSADLVEAIFASPVINPAHLAQTLGISYQTASKYLIILRESGFLNSKKVSKYHLFANHKLIKLLHSQR